MSVAAEDQVRNLPGDEFVVRLWDGMDGEWMDVTDVVDRETAMREWDQRTADGTKCTRYADIDYYRICEAGTTMLFSANGIGAQR